MRQDMLSFAGIVVGLLLFVLLAYRGFNLVLSAMVSSCVIFLFSGVGLLEGLNSIYLPGMADFIKNYFMIFLLGGLLGRLLSDGGNARRVALCLASVIRRSRNNRQFFCVLMVPVLYFFLCYAGISGFVVVFTVLPIAKDLFEETNTPWRLYCCAGAQTVNAAILAGSLQACNVYAAGVCGTSTTAGWKLSLIAVTVFWAVSLTMLRLVLNHARKNREEFLPSGRGIQETSFDEGMAEELLPGILPAVLPLAAVIFLSAVLKLDVVVSLAAGCLLTVVTGARSLMPRLGASLASGALSVYGPVLSVSATYGIGVVLKNVPGFCYFESFFADLPGLLGAPALGVAVAFIMASSVAPIPALGAQMLEQYMAAGVSAANAHRMMMITSFGSIAPHNAGISNAASLLRLSYAECLKMYVLFTWIPGIITTVVAVLCLAVGIV